MGAWGIKALESDSGLDVIDLLEANYNGKYELLLSEIITLCLKEEFLSKDENDIDFFYDNTSIALAELIVMFKKDGEFDYDNEDDKISLRKKKSFRTDKSSIEFILKNLIDIKNEKPDEDGEREYVELWKESDSYNDWKNHLESIIVELSNEVK